ncbi:cytochrome P450 [Apiospora aurea]|uniref:Cytochrome P450 n=1 Tax=Apiospora aurea TaxID=335848 RepID=A0ABR1Q567_9PEZI
MMKLVAQIRGHATADPSYCLYNLFLHPLRSTPGPKLWAMTRVPYTLNFFTGRGPWNARELHARYGPIMRVAPDIVSVGHPDALVQLRGHRTKGKAENHKDDVVYWQMKGNIVGTNREDHSRVRRIISNGFSAQAMMEQQPLIQRYVDLLLQRPRERCDGGRTPLDVTQWHNWATLDLVGDLSFGEPFACLEQGQYHPWVTLTFESMLTMGNTAVLRRFGYGVGNLLSWCFIPRALARKMQEHNALSAVKVERRLGRQAERGHLIGKMLSGSRKQGDEMNKDELVATAAILIIAGPETTAVLLSGATYLLGKHPHILAKLQDEICSSSSSEEEIDLLSTQKLPRNTGPPWHRHFQTCARGRAALQLPPARPALGVQRRPRGSDRGIPGSREGYRQRGDLRQSPRPGTQ